MNKTNKKTLNFTQKQYDFVTFYSVSNKIQDAAIRAGYSKKTAHVTASHLLRNPKIRDSIEKKRKNISQKYAEKVIKLKIMSLEKVLIKTSRIASNKVKKEVCVRDQLTALKMLKEYYMENKKYEKNGGEQNINDFFKNIMDKISSS